MHRIGVLELIHQQQPDLLGKPLGHRWLVESAQRELFHVGVVDEAARGLQALEPVEGFPRDREYALDVAAYVAVKVRVTVIACGRGPHGDGRILAAFGRTRLA